MGDDEMAATIKEQPMPDQRIERDVVGPHGDIPVITRPTGGMRGHSFAASLQDLKSRGYEEEEYFIAGQATRYEQVGLWDDSGTWNVKPCGTAPYKTRLLVRRPVDPSKFNGSVIIYWTNVSAGFENIDDGDYLLDGYAFVAVSVQQAGIEGFKAAPFGLAVWDPERYGDLSHPGDSFSFDIFTQAARAVSRPEARTGSDPLPGLEIRNVIALGASQSAARLLTYANAIQPRDRAVDAIIATVSFGVGAKLDDEIADGVNRVEYTAGGMRAIPSVVPTRVRDDLGTPVMIVNSETEVMPSFAVRQPDSDYFRLWEVTGSTHAPRTMFDTRAKRLERDELPDFIGGLPPDGSVVSISAVTAAALQHVCRWIADGTPPPSQPRIEVAGNPPRIVRDADGIAKGGIRLPEVAAPLATNTSESEDMTGISGLAGRNIPFNADRIRALYPTKDAYLSKVEASVRELVASGALLEPDGLAYIERAKNTALP